MKLCYGIENQIIKIKVSDRVFMLSSTANSPPCPLISTCTAVSVSIKGVLVNFVNSWVLKKIAVSHKTVRPPLCQGAARGSKPAFVWIKMKGFESRLFLPSVTTFNSAEGVDWRESRVEERTRDLISSGSVTSEYKIWNQACMRVSACRLVHVKRSTSQYLTFLSLEYSWMRKIRIIQQEIETDLSVRWQSSCLPADSMSVSNWGKISIWKWRQFFMVGPKGHSE